jgi:hypothetical protein
MKKKKPVSDKPTEEAIQKLFSKVLIKKVKKVAQEKDQKTPVRKSRKEG